MIPSEHVMGIGVFSSAVNDARKTGACSERCQQHWGNAYNKRKDLLL